MRRQPQARGTKAKYRIDAFMSWKESEATTGYWKGELGREGFLHRFEDFRGGECKQTFR